MQIIQILRLPITLSLLTTRVRFRQSLPAIEAGAVVGGKPAVVVSDRFESVVVRLVELLAQVLGAGFDVLGDVFGAFAVWVVGAGDLHEAGGWASCASGVSVYVS